MPSIRAQQLKEIIDASKKMDLYKGKGDALSAILTALEEDLNKQDPNANSYRNARILNNIYLYVMENQGYFTSVKERQNNIMTAYSLLSAFDRDLATNIKNQINADPYQQKGLNLYNMFIKGDSQKKEAIVEDGPKQQKKFHIRPIGKKNKETLDKEDLTKIENIRKLYKFMKKEGDPLLHFNTGDFLQMRDTIKQFLDYVDVAKDAADKALLKEQMALVSNNVAHYINKKLEKDIAPKTPLGQARLAAAMGVLKNVDEEKANKLYEQKSNITNFKSDLIEAIMESPTEVVNVKPLVEKVKEEKRVPNAEAIKKLEEKLADLQEKIKSSLDSGTDKIKMVARYVVLNEIKNQLATKDDGTILDNPKVDENVTKLAYNGTFMAAVMMNNKSDILGYMDEFCKHLPQEMEKWGAKGDELDLITVDPFKKEEIQEPVKVEEQPQKVNNTGAMGLQ